MSVVKKKYINQKGDQFLNSKDQFLLVLRSVCTLYVYYTVSTSQDPNKNHIFITIF